MVKMKMVFAFLLSAALLVTFFACEQASNSDDNNPPSEQVGTWEKTIDLEGGAGTMTLVIKSSGDVIVTYNIDMTLLVQESSSAMGVTEAEFWAFLQTQPSELGETTTYSSSSPWIMSSVETLSYSEIFSKTTITVSGNSLTVSSTVTDDETGEEYHVTVVYTKIT